MKNALTVLFLLVLMVPAVSQGGEEWKKYDLAGAGSIEAPAFLDGSLEKLELAKPDGITAVYEVRYAEFQFAVYIYGVQEDNKEAIQNELNRWTGLKLTSRKEIKGGNYEGVEIAATAPSKKGACVFMRIVRSKNTILNIMMFSSVPLDARGKAMKERYFGSFVVK